MKVCPACGSLKVSKVEALDECGQCGHRRKQFGQLHSQSGNPSNGRYIGDGAYQQTVKKTDPH